MRAIQVRDGIALMSIHDVIPSNEDHVIKTVDWLQDLGITGTTLLVTPFYKMQRVNSFKKNSFFVEYLLSLKYDLSLHGYSHHTKSGSLSEFHKMSRERIQSRMKLGLVLMRKHFAMRPNGFIPPMWMAPKSISKVAKDMGLEYVAYGDTIVDLKKAQNYTTGLNIISQGRSRLNLSDVLLELELGGSAQIAIHPFDHSSEMMDEFIRDLLDRLEYRFHDYHSFLKEMRKTGIP